MRERRKTRKWKRRQRKRRRNEVEDRRILWKEEEAK